MSLGNSFNPAPGYVEVPAAPAVPPRISLLTCAEVVADDSRWTGGYFWDPEQTYTYKQGMVGPIDCPPTVPLQTRYCDPVMVKPFSIVATEKASTFQRKNRDFYGRATRQLLAVEPYIIEREFMLNTLGLTMPWVLDSANAIQTVTTGPLAPWHALANLEQAVAESDQLTGERVMIHVRPHILIELAAATLIRKEGNLWLTPMDSIIVPGRGYPGTGPGGQPVAVGSEWMYATGHVEIRRDKIQYFPEQDPITADNPYGIPASAINRQTNDLMVTAQRIVSVAFNAIDNVFAAEVDNTQSVWGSDPPAP